MGFIKDTDGIARSLKSDKDITYRYADADVNTFLGGGTAGSLVTTGGITAGIQTISGPGAINLTTLYTELTTTGADAFSLANGAAGQIKIITLLVEGGTATITPTTFSNGTSITMDAANDSVSMIYGTNGWQIIAAQAITVNA
jgi:hypothetical protein